MRSPAPAAGRFAEPRRRVGTGESPAGSEGRPPARPPPEPPLPFVFPAEKRPKAGAESRPGGVQVELQGSELWRRFHDIGTEMIITKAGRYRPGSAASLGLCFAVLVFFSFFLFSFF